MAGCASQASGPQPVNVAVVVQDDSANALPQEYAAVKRLINSVSSELDSNNVNVYELSSEYNVSDYQSEPMLLDMARNFRAAPLDYLIILEAEAKVEGSSYTTKVKTRVNGRTLSPNSGRFKGAYSAMGKNITINEECNDYCTNNSIGRSLKSTARDLVDDILQSIYGYGDYKVASSGSEKNSGSPNQSGPLGKEYALVFENFTQQDINQIEGYLEIFSGFERMRYVANSNRYTEINYRSRISRNKLGKNLFRMLDEMEMQGSVKQTGDTVKVIKLSERSKDKPKFDLDGWE